MRLGAGSGGCECQGALLAGMGLGSPWVWVMEALPVAPPDGLGFSVQARCAPGKLGDTGRPAQPGLPGL